MEHSIYFFHNISINLTSQITTMIIKKMYFVCLLVWVNRLSFNINLHLTDFKL